MQKRLAMELAVSVLCGSFALAGTTGIFANSLRSNNATSLPRGSTSIRAQDAPVSISSFGDAKEAAAAILASPRPYSGYAANFPILPQPLPPPWGDYAKDWVDFGAIAVDTASATATVEATNYPRIFGIAVLGDFTEADQCGSGGEFAAAPCAVQVSFHPQHAGFSSGMLVIVVGFPNECSEGSTSPLCGKTTVELEETRLTGYGVEPEAPRYAGGITAGASIADALSVPWLENGSHCFAQSTNSEAPTLTGVFVEVDAAASRVILHHSSSRAATFDIYCTSPGGNGATSAPGAASAVPMDWPRF